MKNAFGFQFFPKGIGSIEFLFSTILMIVVFVRMRTQGARFGADILNEKVSHKS